MSIFHDRIGRSRAVKSLITKIEESSWQISDIDIPYVSYTFPSKVYKYLIPLSEDTAVR